jgi:acylaminoacyl-peptidase
LPSCRLGTRRILSEDRTDTGAGRISRPVVVDFSMYNQLSTLPLPTSAQFYSQSSLSIVFDVRDHARNVKRVVTRTVILPPQTISTACEEVSSDVILSLVSPSKSYRAILRDLSKTGGPGRFVEIWNNDRLVACKNVTCAHGQFTPMVPYYSSFSYRCSSRRRIYILDLIFTIRNFPPIHRRAEPTIFR